MKNTLTDINQELVGQSRMVYVVNGCGKQGSCDFQWCENGLQSDKQLQLADQYCCALIGYQSKLREY